MVWNNLWIASGCHCIYGSTTLVDDSGRLSMFLVWHAERSINVLGYHPFIQRSSIKCSSLAQFSVVDDRCTGEESSVFKTNSRWPISLVSFTSSNMPQSPKTSTWITSRSHLPVLYFCMYRDYDYVICILVYYIDLVCHLCIVQSCHWWR